jgi:hypothetical protein
MNDDRALARSILGDDSAIYGTELAENTAGFANRFPPRQPGNGGTGHAERFGQGGFAGERFAPTTGRRGRITDPLDHAQRLVALRHDALI